MAKEERTELERLKRCFTPLCGMWFGFAVGVLIDFISNPTDLIMRGATKLFALLLAFGGWAIFTLISGKKLRCGGTDARTYSEDEKSQYNWLMSITGFFVVLAGLLLLCCKCWWGSVIATVFAGLVLCGEIGWGKPLKVFSHLYRRIGGGRDL